MNTNSTSRLSLLSETWGQFEAELEDLRQQLKVPGMSAAVVKDGQLAWSRGFGYADVENSVPAASETPYHLASVTKPFAALVVMQLVQEGKLSLGDPVSRYSVNLPEGDKVLVRHLMSHTSDGTPGQRYQYNSTRYGLLSQVVLAATGRSLQEWLYERILQPLGMENTAPGLAGCTGLPFVPACERVGNALALPYRLDQDLNFIPGNYQPGFSAVGGLISTVIDLARFDAALDANTLVTAATKELMWTPSVSNSGQKLPYGLGWFTQTYRGTRLIWHYGLTPPSASALFLKLPDEGLTFIVLANTDGLSRSVPWNESDVLDSLVALAFYKQFGLAPRYGQPLPAIDWSADSSTVLVAINQVQDEAVRDLLNREFEARHTLVTSLADLKATNERLAAMRATADEIARSLDPHTLDLYASVYEFSDLGGFTLDVTRDGNKLYVTWPGQVTQELLPLSTTRFFVPVGYDFYQFGFVPEAAGVQTYHLVLTLEGMSLTGRKK